MDKETLPGGTVVFTEGAHRLGTDALLLADFAPVRKGYSACDLGSGCGILALGLADRGLAGEIIAVELDEEAAGLIRLAAGENGLANLRVEQCDLRGFKNPRPVDLVVSNPPYFSAGPRPVDSARAVARHDVSAGIENVCRTAARLLKDKGRLCICWPARGLARAFAAMQMAQLAPKRLQLVRKSHEAEPWLALIEACKFGGEGLAIEPDRILPPGQPVRY